MHNHELEKSQANTVDFGNETVSPLEKTKKVHDVFSRVASQYDLMNDLMSFGFHRIIKQVAVEMTGLASGDSVLDLAGGTGDISKKLHEVVGSQGTVILADINEHMVSVGRDRLIDSGIGGVKASIANGEQLPFQSNTFDSVITGFGLRNMTHKDKALLEILRVLRPRGIFIVLEFSQPDSQPLSELYRMFQAFWPIVGKLLVGDSKPYKYLIESIEKHPSKQALELMMQDAGFINTRFVDLLGGIIAIHRGQK